MIGEMLLQTEEAAHGEAASADGKETLCHSPRLPGLLWRGIQMYGAREAFGLPFRKPQARRQKFWDGYCFFVRNGV